MNCLRKSFGVWSLWLLDDMERVRVPHVEPSHSAEYCTVRLPPDDDIIYPYIRNTLEARVVRIPSVALQ